MNELRLRAVRDPDAPPVDKVEAASGWARQGSGASRRSAGDARGGVGWLFDPLWRQTAAPGLGSARVLGCGTPAECVSGVSKSGFPGTRLGSDWGWYLRGAESSARGLRTAACLLGLVGGVPASPPHPGPS